MRPPLTKKTSKKHKNDILRLHQLLSIDENINLPLSIKGDLREFLQRIEKDSIDLKTLELKNTTYEPFAKLHLRRNSPFLCRIRDFWQIAYGQ